jgi:hypothetical protein
MKLFNAPVIVLAISTVALSACGDGGDGSGGQLGSSDGRIFAGTGEIVPEDYVGRTFPTLFLFSEDQAPQAQSTTGEGTIRIVDNDTLVVTIPGESPFTFTRVSADRFEDASGTTVTIDDFGAAQYLLKSGGDPSIGFAAAYGFETPVGLRPVSARYNSFSASSLVFAGEGDAFAVGLTGPGTVDLEATFSGSGGTISGVLIDAAGDVDFVDDRSADDRISVRTTLDGVITEGGFTGTVDGSATLVIGGTTTPRDLGLVLSNSSAEGKFFGNAAQVASGIYDADASITLPGQQAERARVTGFFIAE